LELGRGLNDGGTLLVEALSGHKEIAHGQLEEDELGQFEDGEDLLGG
jgi:hypothetical protein